MTKQNEQMVHVRLSKYMYAEIKHVSKKLGMTISDVIRLGINEVIKKELTKQEQENIKEKEE